MFLEDPELYVDYDPTTLRCGCVVYISCCACQGRDAAKCLRHYTLDFWHVYCVKQFCVYHDRPPYTRQAWRLMPTEVEKKEVRKMLRLAGISASRNPINEVERRQATRERGDPYKLVEVVPMLPDGSLKDPPAKAV